MYFVRNVKPANVGANFFLTNRTNGNARISTMNMNNITNELNATSTPPHHHFNLTDKYQKTYALNHHGPQNFIILPSLSSRVNLHSTCDSSIINKFPPLDNLAGCP